QDTSVQTRQGMKKSPEPQTREMNSSHERSHSERSAPFHRWQNGGEKLAYASSRIPAHRPALSATPGLADRSLLQKHPSRVEEECVAFVTAIPCRQKHSQACCRSSCCLEDSSAGFGRTCLLQCRGSRSADLRILPA